MPPSRSRASPLADGSTVPSGWRWPYSGAGAESSLLGPGPGAAQRALIRAKVALIRASQVEAADAVRRSGDAAELLASR